MIDSSSDEEKLSSAEMMMARDLMDAKMEAAKSSAHSTHLLMIGNFRMELVPSKNIDADKTFRETLKFLHEKYGNEIFKGISEERGHMHG
jgi:hypothetical protein